MSLSSKIDEDRATMYGILSMPIGTVEHTATMLPTEAVG